MHFDPKRKDTALLMILISIRLTGVEIDLVATDYKDASGTKRYVSDFEKIGCQFSRQTWSGNQRDARLM